MAVDADLDLLTIDEAAKLLKVSTITLYRWLKQGRLPAYHLGPRYIRIRRQDISRVLSPVVRSEAEAPVESARITVKPMTDEAVELRLKAIKQSEGLISRMRARRGGKSLPSSWELIRQTREDRSKRI